MASVTTWTRLEPRCRDGTLEDGLAATLHDPLWMLGRQWQLGEFAGQDAGTVVQARVHVRAVRLDRCRPQGVDPDADAVPYDPRRQPLEALVEGETPDEAIPRRVNLRAAAEAGMHFARLLGDEGVGAYAGPFRERYPMERGEAGGGEGRFLSVMAGRAIDGVRLHDGLGGLAREDDGALAELPADPPVDEGDRAAVARAAGRWLDWWADTHGAPAAGRSAWVPERMTHRFATSALTSHGEVTLVADEHPGGRLDWWAFDHAADVSLRGDGDGDADAPQETVTVALPSRVRYRGVPTTSWWELEDARADFGAVDTGPEDLARLLFVELVNTYGNDWFLVPVEAEVGCLCEVRSLVVTDTFGQRTLIRHAADLDGDDGWWRMFDLGVPAGHDVRRMMLLAPTLPASQRGPVVEEVLLRRDDVANLAWAVERTVPDALGDPVDRLGVAPVTEPGAPPGAAQAPYRYRLATDVPPHWFPLVPRQGADDGSVRLVLGRMRTDPGTSSAEPLGALLRADDPLSLRDEDLPRAGVEVTRRDERTRWSDGSTHGWRARRRRVGGGEAWSGLRFDVVEPADWGGGA